MKPSKHFFRLIIITLLLFNCQPEDIIRPIDLEQKQALTEIDKLKIWVDNNGSSENIYQAHLWDKAELTHINSSDYVIVVPLNIKSAHNNYTLRAKYIYRQNSYISRIEARPVEQFKDNLHYPVFSIFFEKPDQLNLAVKQSDIKISNYSFKEVAFNTLSKSTRGGCNCSTFWSRLWDRIKSLGSSIWGGIQSLTKAIGNFFSTWSHGNPTGTGGYGSYTLYEYGSVIEHGSDPYVLMDLFWMPNSTSNGEMYHFVDYTRAMQNFETLFKKLTTNNPDINPALLLKTMLEYHMPRHFHDEINDGTIAYVFNVLVGQDIDYRTNSWKLLQDFIYRFYDTASYNIKLNTALNNFTQYQSDVLNALYKIENNLTGRAKCVYEKLKTHNGNLFKTTIGKFIDDPVYNLILTTGRGNCSAAAAACTDGDDVDTHGTITITIQNVSQPALELAATILHEGIHAELFRYVSRKKKGVDPNDRPRLFQLYQYYKGLTDSSSYNGRPVTDAQHTYMAENYVKPIAEAIRSLDGNRYSLEYYMWYGWEGLESYDFKNKLSNGLDTTYNNYQQIVNRNTNVKCN